MTRSSTELPDGSWAIVEPQPWKGMPGALVSRETYEGEVVWGQAFVADMVPQVVAAMKEDPFAFDRTCLWDTQGRAVR